MKVSLARWIPYVCLCLAVVGCGKKSAGEKPANSKSKSGMQTMATTTGMAVLSPRKRPEPIGPKRGFLSKAQLELLIKTQVDGFDRGQGAKVLNADIPMGWMFYRSKEANEHKRRATVAVHLNRCRHCQKIDLAAWRKQKRAFFYLSMPSVHKENPKLVFEVGKLIIGQRKVFTIYRLSHVEKNNGGAISRASTHELIILYTDGINEIRVRVGSTDAKGAAPVKSLAALKKTFTRAELIAAGKKVFAAFEKVWKKK